MRRRLQLVMAGGMFVWAAFNLCSRPGYKTGWYIAGLVVAVLLGVLDVLGERWRD